MTKELDILITGGARFIGSHLATKLVTKGYNIKVLDNLSTGKLSNINSELLAARIDFVKGDISDAQLVEECVNRVDVVIHLAAQTSVPFSIQNPDLYDAVNIRGTSNLLQSSFYLKNNAKVNMGS